MTDVPFFVRFGTVFDSAKEQEYFAVHLAADRLQHAPVTDTAEAVMRLGNNQIIRTAVVAVPVLVATALTSPAAFIWNWLLMAALLVVPCFGSWLGLVGHLIRRTGVDGVRCHLLLFSPLYALGIAAMLSVPLAFGAIS